MRLIDETGNQYGHLTVVRKDDSHIGTGGAVWLCRCDCGGERLVTGGKLRNGTVTRCLKCSGMKRIDYKPGMVVGSKTVIRQTQRSATKSDLDRFEVRCTCGEVYEVTRSSLRNAHDWCRRCYGKSLVKNEEGKKYGMLTVIRKVPAPAYYGDQHKQYYECQCECGQTVIKTGMELRSGKAFSCGCTIRSKRWRREHGCEGGTTELLQTAIVADGEDGRPQGGAGKGH